LLINATNANLKALSELCLNLLQGNLKINMKTKLKLKRHRKPIETLANRKVSLKKKKKIINQKGSGAFLLPLATTALPLVGNLLSKAISSVVKSSRRKRRR
jgi:hypothetical protein